VKAVCGIDFVMGVTDKEASKAERYVHFDERLHSFLTKEENTAEFKFLLGLDPYRQTIIYTKNILELIEICNALLHKYRNNTEVTSFALQLKKLCEEALHQKKHIYAIGD
jgi:hypothetical protein